MNVDAKLTVKPDRIIIEIPINKQNSNFAINDDDTEEVKQAKAKLIEYVLEGL